MHLTCLSVDAINVRRLHQLKQPATPPGPVPETAPLGWAAVLKFSLLLERFRLAGTHTRSGLGMWTSIFKPREHLRHQAKVRDGFLAQNNQGMDTSISAFARIADRETWAEHPPFLPALNLNMNMNEDEPSLLKRCDPINRTPERPAPPEHVAFQPEVAQFPSLTRTPDLEKPKHPPVSDDGGRTASATAAKIPPPLPSCPASAACPAFCGKSHHLRRTRCCLGCGRGLRNSPPASHAWRHT